MDIKHGTMVLQGAGYVGASFEHPDWPSPAWAFFRDVTDDGVKNLLLEGFDDPWSDPDGNIDRGHRPAYDALAGEVMQLQEALHRSKRPVPDFWKGAVVRAPSRRRNTTSVT